MTATDPTTIPAADLDAGVGDFLQAVLEALDHGTAKRLAYEATLPGDDLVRTYDRIRALRAGYAAEALAAVLDDPVAASFRSALLRRSLAEAEHRLRCGLERSRRRERTNGATAVGASARGDES